MPSLPHPLQKFLVLTVGLSPIGIGAVVTNALLAIYPFNRLTALGIFTLVSGTGLIGLLVFYNRRSSD